MTQIETADSWWGQKGISPHLPCVDSLSACDSTGSAYWLQPAPFGCFLIHILPHIHHWTQLQVSPFPRATCVIWTLLRRALSIPALVFGNGEFS